MAGKRVCTVSLASTVFLIWVMQIVFMFCDISDQCEQMAEFVSKPVNIVIRAVCIVDIPRTGFPVNFMAVMPDEVFSSIPVRLNKLSDKKSGAYKGDSGRCVSVKSDPTGTVFRGKVFEIDDIV